MAPAAANVPPLCLDTSTTVSVRDVAPEKQSLKTNEKPAVVVVAEAEEDEEDVPSRMPALSPGFNKSHPQEQDVARTVSVVVVVVVLLVLVPVVPAGGLIVVVVIIVVGGHVPPQQPH